MYWQFPVEPTAFDLREERHLGAEGLGELLKAAREAPVRIHVLRDSQPDRRLLTALGASSGRVFCGLGWTDPNGGYLYQLNLSGCEPAEMRRRALDAGTGC